MQPPNNYIGPTWALCVIQGNFTNATQLKTFALIRPNPRSPPDYCIASLNASWMIGLVFLWSPWSCFSLGRVHLGLIPHICHFFYTDRIFENQILHPKKQLKAPKTLKMSLKVKYMHFFHSIWKNLHLTENFYTDMSVVSVTNMRYASVVTLTLF